MKTEKHEQLVAELGTVHTSIEKLVAALGLATRKCEQQENHKLRLEINANQGKVADLQKLRCQLAQEQVAARYLEIEQKVEEERANQEGMALEESSVIDQLAAIQEKMTAFDCAPSWQLKRLTQQTKRIVVGPLRRALEVKLAAEQQAHQAAVDQANELESQLETIKGELSDSGTREAALKAELEKILALCETHYRLLRGSLQEIRTALADPCITVDRWAAEKLLQIWAKSFSETLGGSGCYGDEIEILTFKVESAGIFYWNDTGEIADSIIFKAMAGNQIWPKSGDVPFKLEQGALEQKRAAQQSQPVGA